MPLTAAERRARIRARLREAEEPEGRVEAVTQEHMGPTPQEETEPEEPSYSTTQPTVARRRRVPNAVKRTIVQRRVSKPPNYKLHVLTALSLAVAIRVVRYGSKALTG